MAQPWPAAAPQFADSWSQQDQPIVVRTEMDVGPPKVRRRATRVKRSFNVGFTGTQEQAIALLTFFELDCQSGVEFHEFLNPFTNVVEEFRFTEAPQFTNLGPLGATLTCVWEQL